MRMFVGMLLGCLLTIAAAYIHDSMPSARAADGTMASDTIVNWDTAARKWASIKETARTAWLKLQSVDGSVSTKGA